MKRHVEMRLHPGLLLTADDIAALALPMARLWGSTDLSSEPTPHVLGGLRCMVWDVKLSHDNYVLHIRPEGRVERD